MAVVDSLIATLSFDFDGKALEEFNNGMKQAGKAVAVVAAGATAAGAAIFAFTSKIAEQNDEIGKTAQIIGITAQSINELGFVSELSGSSVGAMNSSLENLCKTASEAARGLGAGVEAFGLLGISATDANGQIKQTDELMLDVADAVSQLGSQSEKLELLNKLGIDSSLLLALDQGSAAIRKQREEVAALGFVLDKDATDSAAKFNDEMLRVSTVVKGIASAIGTKLMKQINPMIEVFLEWFKANKEIIKQNLNSFFEKLTTAIGAIFKVAARVVGVVNAIVQSFGGWANAIGIVSAALLALNIRILIIPALILAAGAAMFLLIEDLIAFSNGADSQMGKLAERSKTFKIILLSLLDVFKMVSTGWGLIFSDGDKALQGLLIIVEQIGQSITDFIMAPINALSEGFEGVSNFFGGDQAATPALAPTGGSTSTDNSNRNITVNVDGGNPEAVKQAVSEALGTELQATETNLGSKVAF